MRRLPPDNVGYAAATQLEGSVQGPSSRICGEVKDHPRDILRTRTLNHYGCTSGCLRIMVWAAGVLLLRRNMQQLYQALTTRVHPLRLLALP